MARPAVVWTFADASAVNRSAIPTAIQDEGFVPLTPAVAQYVNEGLYQIGLWVDFIQPFVPADGRLEANTLRATTGNLALEATAAGTGDISISAQDVIAITATTQLRLAGETTVVTGVVPNPSDMRYTYPSGDRLVLTYQVSPVLGGYMIISTNATPTAGISWRLSGTGASLYNATGGAEDCVARRALDIFPGNAEADATQVRYQVTSLSSTWAAATSDTSLVLYRRAIATGVETALLTVTGAAPTDVTGAPIDLDPATYSYFLEFREDAVNNNANTETLEEAVLTVSKRAVE